MCAFAPMAGGMEDVELQAALVKKRPGSRSEAAVFSTAPQARKFGSNCNVRVVEFTELPHSPSIGQRRPPPPKLFAEPYR
jgi:hypothetical protein